MVGTPPPNSGPSGSGSSLVLGLGAIGVWELDGPDVGTWVDAPESPAGSASEAEPPFEQANV
jgi:hypothetical protein